MEERTFAIDTPEYRTAWLKSLMGKPLTGEEERAYTVANGATAKITANAIMEKVRDHAMLLDKTTVLYANGKITYYVEGVNDAATDHTENKAMTAAADTMVPIELSPAGITKLIQISAEEMNQSIDKFEETIVKLLSDAIARKINAKIVEAITGAAASAGTSVSAATVQTLLGTVKGNNVSILCNNKTLYTKLLPLQDNGKSSIVRFEGAQATVYGCPVLIDDNVTADVVLAGDLSKLICAISENVNVKRQYHIDSDSYKYLGVAQFAVKPGVNEAFAKLAAV